MIIVDTGVLLGTADEDDQDHQRCAQLLRSHRGQLIVPAPAVAESAWQIERNLGPAAEARFLGLITDQELKVADLSLADYGRCAELIGTYADLRLGFVDASIVTVAENLSIATIATLNRRDFTVVRPRHIEGFELLP